MGKITYILIAALFITFSAYAQEITPHADVKPTVDKMTSIRELREESNVPHPNKNNDIDTKSYGGKVVTSLGLCIGILLIGAWGYKKFYLKDIPSASKRMRVVERLMLGPRMHVTLIEVENQKVLVGASSDGMTLLELSSAVEDAEIFEKELVESYGKKV